MGFLTLILSLLLSSNTLVSEGTLTNDTPVNDTTTTTGGGVRGNNNGDFIIQADIRP